DAAATCSSTSLTATPRHAWSGTRQGAASTPECSGRWWWNATTACASASAPASATHNAPIRRRWAAWSRIATTGWAATACRGSHASCTCVTCYRRRSFHQGQPHHELRALAGNARAENAGLAAVEGNELLHKAQPHAQARGHAVRLRVALHEQVEDTREAIGGNAG